MRVLKKELYDQGIQSFYDQFIAGFEGGKENKLISPSDANVLVHGYENPNFQKVLDDYHINLPDGVPSVWLGKIQGAKKMNRCSGPEVFPALLNLTKGKAVKHYFIGGKPSALETLKNVIETEIGNPNCCGFFSPPFKEFSISEIQAMAIDVNESGADVLWIGLGAPKQIYFAHEIAKYTNCHYIVPVGAAFDFFAGTVPSAPNWMKKNGLEWFFRLISEPRRLGKRYLNVVPKFLYYGIKEMF